MRKFFYFIFIATFAVSSFYLVVTRKVLANEYQAEEKKIKVEESRLIAEQQLKEQYLKEVYQLKHSKPAVIKVAREKFGLSFPNEKIYKYK